MEELKRVYRPRGFLLLWRSMAVGFGAAMLVVAAEGPGPDPGPEDYAGAVVLGAAFFLGLWRVGRMRLECSSDGVTVVGYFTDRHMRWADIAGFTVDYAGLHVVGTDGVMTARMLGKPNWRSWTGRRSRNEDIADQLTALRASTVPSDTR